MDVTAAMRTSVGCKALLAAVMVLRLSACGGSKGGNSSDGFHPTGPTAQVVVTTGDQSKLLAAQGTATFGTGGTENTTAITVNEAKQYQPIDGFGASLTDSSAG